MMMYRSSVIAILIILGLSGNVALAGKFYSVAVRYILCRHWISPP